MKILYHHRIASKDGQYVHVEGMTTALKEAGHELHIVSPKFSDESDFGSEGGIAAKLKALLPQWFYELLEFAYSLLVACKLIVAIIQFKPDVIYERYNTFQPAGVILAKLFGLPILQEVNAPLVAERSKYSGLTLKRFAKAIENFTWRSSSILLPVTDVLAGHLRAVGVPDNKIVVIPNGIHESFLADMDQRVKNRAHSDSLVIGFTGFIHPWHGLDIALQAIAEVERKDIRFICVGEGDIRADLEKLAVKLGIADRVEFTGLVSREKIIDYVSQFDIALQPAVTEYASPLKLFEYLACGSLVIAPDMDNIREILDEKSALLFEVTDSNANFKEQLVYALNNYGALQDIRIAARELIESKGLTWQKNAERVVGLANGLLAA